MASKSWLITAILAILGIAALITIFAAGGSGGIDEPSPLPAAPSKVISALLPANREVVRLKVGEYLTLALPEDHTYSAVVEQADQQNPVLEDLNLPGQEPQMRGDSPGHATVEVMSEPICQDHNGCPDRRTLLGTLDVTVTR